MMRVINRNILNKGDDEYFDRLLSYFQEQFHEDIIQFIPIRKSVFFIETKRNTYIVKGYHTNSRLRLQEAFTETLRTEGFRKTYVFLPSPTREPLFFEGTYFGCIQYIPPHKTPFSFQLDKNRHEGMDLLEQFHNTTVSFEARYRTLLPKSQLIEKWHDRFHKLTSNLPFLGYFINRQFTSEMVSWADWSLAGMERNREFFHKEPFVILHGDVAHHNFLRDQLGNLHLIDFDLISIGSPSADYLQYANRILPFMDWSFDKLMLISQMKKYGQDEGFLYALAYPADIFREWNRMIREKSYSDPQKMKQVMDLTINQFMARKKFVDHIKNIVNS